jgi:osmoprotectant transport system permease protein
MSENLREQLLLLPGYFQGHLVLVISAMMMGILISMPLGIWAAQSRRIKGPLLAVVSVIQTFPSLAILALTVALLGGRIGFLPAFIALTLYCMLPIVRNTVTGLETVPADIVEAARAMGMTSGQILQRVKLPLALPVIIAGIRTAMVWTVGLATLSTLVGAVSFGNYIFIGIQTSNLTAVTVGSLASAVMAIVLDSIIAGLQWIAEARVSNLSNQRMTLIKRVVGSSLVILFGVSLFTFMPRAKPDFIIGGKSFTEQHIMAGLLTAELEKAGFSVDQRLGLGTDVVYNATKNGTVDLYVEYTGTIWANQMNETSNPGRVEVRTAVTEYVANNEGMVSIGPTGFQNLYSLAMRRDRAAELGISSIEDLVSIASTLICGADLEFFGRPEWFSLRDTYNIDFSEKLSFDPTLMYTAVNERQVDLITAYSTDGRVSAYDLLILDDPRSAFLPYDGIFLASAAAAQNADFIDTVAPLVNSISDQLMREANRMVDVEGRSVSDAVGYLLANMQIQN